MLNRKTFVLWPSLVFLASCASVPQIATPKRITTTENLVQPEIGVTAKRDVGETIFVQQYGKKTTQRLSVLSQDLKRDPDLKSSGYSVIIPNGAKGVLADNEESACFQNMGRNAGIYGSEGRSLFCLTDQGKTGFYTRAIFGSINNWGDFEIPPTPYRIEEAVIGYGPDSIKRELVFQGLSNGQAQVLYREYTASDMVRPAFTQSVSYDLSETKTIGFKGARIKVIKATGVDIEYVVEKYFN
jgi:hypothetical protein